MLLVYPPALSAPFIWDDNLTVTGNPFIRNPDGLRLIWFSAQALDYYPVTWTSLWLEWRLWQLEPAGYHATNIALHGAGVVLLWRILLRLEVPGSWLIALLFGVHPLAVDSVVWISQRKNTLSMVCACLSLLFYLRCRAGQRPVTSYWLSIITFTAALLSKSSVVTLPIVFLIIGWARSGPLSRRDFARVSPHFLLAALASLLTLWFQGKTIGLGLPHDNRPAATILAHLSASREGLLHFPEQLLLAGQAFWFYLLKTLLPAGLCMVYERWEIDAGRLAAWLPGLGVLAAAALLWACRKRLGRGPVAAFAIAFVLLLPVLGFFKMAYHAYAWTSNHLAYVSIPAFLSLGALTVSAGLKRIPFPAQGRSLAIGLAVVVALLFTVQTRRRIALHRDPEALWRDNIARAPAAFAAHNSLGVILCQRGRYEEGIRMFEASARMAPSLLEAGANLGAAYLSAGRVQDAIRQFESLHPRHPDHIPTLANLAIAYTRSGRLEEAAELHQKILQLRPGDPRSISNLAVIRGRLKQDAEAEPFFRRALVIDPASATLHAGFAELLYRQGAFDQALDHALRAVALKSESAETLGRAAAEARDRARENGNHAVVELLEAHIRQLRAR